MPPSHEQYDQRGVGVPVDLNQIFQNNDVKISPPESADDAAHRRRLETWRFIAAILVFGIVFGASLYAVLSPTTAVEDKKWFFGVLGLMIGGVAGYLFKGGK